MNAKTKPSETQFVSHLEGTRPALAHGFVQALLPRPCWTHQCSTDEDAWQESALARCFPCTALLPERPDLCDFCLSVIKILIVCCWYNISHCISVVGAAPISQAVKHDSTAESEVGCNIECNIWMTFVVVQYLDLNTGHYNHYISTRLAVLNFNHRYIWKVQRMKDKIRNAQGPVPSCFAYFESLCDGQRRSIASGTSDAAAS